MPAVPTTGASQSLTPNSKRSANMAPNQSLNHLLNFSLPPRQTHQFSHGPRRRKPGTTAAVWNKERFVNAQYRFVMDPRGDYTVNFADPDIYFQWQDILQVIVPRTSAVASATGPREGSHNEEGQTTCPICLSLPTAPRMTKCGHIFCFPCILHYLNTSENPKWARCPICFDSITEWQLKAVKWIDSAAIQDEDDLPPAASSSSSATDNAAGSTPRPGSVLRMRLIQRPMMTTLALPRSETWPSDLIPLHQAPFHFLPDVYAFSKFMLPTPTSLIADLTHDLDELTVEKRTLASMHDDLGVAFVESAEVKVHNQIAKATALETPQLKQAVDAAYHSLERLQERAAHRTHKVADAGNTSAPLDDAPDAFLALQSPGGQVALPPPALDAQSPNAQGRNPRQRRNVNPPPPAPSSYYYYQVASGLPIFLHPLDIKILFSHFHSYTAFPDTITLRVEHSKESTVNDELRKRWKYLSHLPEGADVVFVETELEGIVGREGLKPFERALNMRRSRRNQRTKRDDMASTRAEERERRKLVNEWNELTRHDVDAYIPPPVPREPSPAAPDFNDFPEPGQERVAPPVSQQASGVWGARSFASAAHHNAGGARIVPQPRPARHNGHETPEDAWDLDLAFHDLEQRASRGGGGGKRKNNKMVVLGGGGGRRR